VNKILLLLACMAIPTSMLAAELVLPVPKPTQEELKQYWDAKYTGDKIIFDLIAQYGKNIVNEVEDDTHDPMLIYAATASFSGWTSQKFEQLLKTPGIDINGKEGRKLTPLERAMLTARNGDPKDDQLQKIKLLILYGVNFNQKDSVGCTHIMRAALFNQPTVVSMLLAAGASTNEAYVTQGHYAGKTFFDLAQHSTVQEAYKDYRKNIHILIGKQIADVKVLVHIIEDYLFTPVPIDKAFNVQSIYSGTN